MWMDEPFGMFSVMNTLFPILFFGVFAVVILTFVVVLVRGAGQWRRNNAAPVLTVEAEVVGQAHAGKPRRQGARGYDGYDGAALPAITPPLRWKAAAA